MTLPLWRALLACLTMWLAACSYPIRNDAIATAERPTYDWEALEDGSLKDTLVIFTASGGGTRATALAMAVLTAMDKVRLPAGGSLVDEIDIMSSVSGGSVTAGYFALHGKAGLPTLEQNFVRRDGIGALLAEGLNPVGLAALATPSKERIDLLVDYLDRQLFAQATFDKLIERRKRPFLILNAADMVEGTPFPFTQYTMDLLCSDLARMKISTAVAASAAFPVALSPVTLKNYHAEKCPKRPPLWIRAAANTSWYVNPPRVVWGRTAAAYASGSKQYIHLLDGGIADNLGVSEPYRLLTTDDVAPLLKQDVADGRIRKIIFVMVNARSFTPSELDRSQATPGMIAMLSASINSPIDRATFGTAERIRLLLTERYRAVAEEITLAASQTPPGMSAEAVRVRRESLLRQAANFKAVAASAEFIAVDFDAIPDATCRAAFHRIATTWTLPGEQINALKVMGEALFAASPDYAKSMKALGVQPPAGTFPTVRQACETIAGRGE